MQFKKFLCFTLTSVMTFTATLGSLSSIFAEDIKETEESQCFGSLILEKMKNYYENSNDDTISVSNSNNNSSEISQIWTCSVHDEIANSKNRFIKSDFSTDGWNTIKSKVSNQTLDLLQYKITSVARLKEIS